MLPTLVRKYAARPNEPIPYDFDANPYKAKQIWPPDFQKLSPKHQFRFERRYKRRAQLKWARPRWMIATKLVQWGSIVGLGVYGVLFMDWGGDKRAFKSVRDWYKQTTSSIWTDTTR